MLQMTSWKTQYDRCVYVDNSVDSRAFSPENDKCIKENI